MDIASDIKEQSRRLADFANAIHSAANEIEHEMPREASDVRDAAGRIESVASRLRARGLDDQFNDGDGRSAPSRPGSRDDAKRPSDDRGRVATKSSEVPGSGWKDVLLRVYNDISSHRILAIAAGVTFYGLLAVFPAIGALVAIYGLFADPATVATRLDQLTAVLPGGAIDVVRDQMTRVASQSNGKLGLTFAFGLAMALWSANAGVKAIFDALNVVYDEQEKRGFFKLNAVSLLFTGGAVIFLVLATAAFVAFPAAMKALGFDGGTETLVRLIMAAVVFAIMTLGMAVLYRFGPSRTRPRWRWITWGSVSASVAWIAASMMFSWYAANFGNFNKTYGSLGAVIGFMTWIWLSAIVILLGAELNAEMEPRTAGGQISGRSDAGRSGAAVANN